MSKPTKNILIARFFQIVIILISILIMYSGGIKFFIISIIFFGGGGIFEFLTMNLFQSKPTKKISKEDRIHKKIKNAFL